MSDDKLREAAKDYSDRNSMPEDHFNMHHSGLEFGFIAGAEWEKKYSTEKYSIAIDKGVDVYKREIEMLKNEIESLREILYNKEEKINDK